MKYALALLIMVGLLLSGGQARADYHDAIWISECIKDNAEARVPTEVIIKYCTCMNNKMDRSETRSITQWEKIYVEERRDCDRQAGWR